MGGETPSATSAVPTPAGAARRVPIAAGRSGLGFLGRRGEHPGGEPEQRQAGLTQEAAAPEPDIREVLLTETLLEIRQLPIVHRHTNSPPFNLFLFRDLYDVFHLRRTVSGFHELDKVGGALVQVGLSGDRSALDLEGERRAF